MLVSWATHLGVDTFLEHSLWMAKDSLLSYSLCFDMLIISIARERMMH